MLSSFRSTSPATLSPIATPARPACRRHLAPLFGGVLVAASLLGPGAAPTLAASAPSTPQNGHLTAGVQSLTLGWTAPASSGDSPLTGYTVYFFNANATVLSAPASAVSSTLKGVLAGSGGWAATVCAVNAVGSSSCSDSAEIVTPLAPSPTAPTGGQTPPRRGL